MAKTQKNPAPKKAINAKSNLKHEVGESFSYFSVHSHFSRFFRITTLIFSVQSYDASHAELWRKNRRNLAEILVQFSGFSAFIFSFSLFFIRCSPLSGASFTKLIGNFAWIVLAVLFNCSSFKSFIWPISLVEGIFPPAAFSADGLPQVCSAT